MKRAGILPLYNVEASILGRIKQSLLLFDTVGVSRLNETIRYWNTQHGENCRHRPVIDSLINLAETEFVFDPMPHDSVPLRNDSDGQALQGSVDRLYTLIEQKANPEVLMDAYARMNAITLNSAKPAKDFIAIPIVSTDPQPMGNDRSTRVLRLIIENMPMPAVDVPLGRILDFKRENANGVQLQALQQWMRKASKGQDTITELNEELQYLLSQFTEAMRLHDIRYNNSKLQTLIVTPLEIMEDLVKLRFSKLAKAAFSLTEANLALAQAELSAPGKEVAYIYSARRVFSH